MASSREAPSALSMSAAFTPEVCSTSRGPMRAAARSAVSRRRDASAAHARPAISNSSSRTAGRSSGGNANSTPRSAIPSLIRHSGVLISTSSTRPGRARPDRGPSRRARGGGRDTSRARRFVPDRAAAAGRSVLMSILECSPPSYQLYADHGWLRTKATRSRSPVGSPNSSAERAAESLDQPVDHRR